MSDHWITAFCAFFHERGPAIAEVLGAWSCRETWLHGELFRYFRRKGVRSFGVNRLEIAPRQKADFSADVPFPIVGELKIIGSAYENKCVTGGALAPLLERLDRPLTDADRDLDLGPWDLIPDFFRLLDCAVKTGRAPYLILLTDLASDDSSPLAQALTQIQFLQQSCDITLPRGSARLWSLRTDAA